MLLLLLSGCEADKRKEAATHPGFSTAGVNAAKPVTEQTATFVKEATAEATHVQAALPRPAGKPPTSYLALRRAIAAAAPYFRPRAKMGSEILLGPLRSIEEGGGALAELDLALTEGDEDGARKALTQVIRALRLIDNELTLEAVPPEVALQTLSDAAYDLGLRVAEAYPGVPASPEAVLADTRGHLEGMAAITRALMKRVEGTPVGKSAEAPSRTLLTQIAAMQRRVDGVSHAHALTRRAELIVATGPIGVSARRLGQALGVKVDLPHRARRPQANNGLEEPIHALVLPAARHDPRSGDGKVLARLGGQLFVDRRLSKNSQRACIDCHQPAYAYGDHVARSPSLDPSQPLKRNTPGLLYTSVHAAQLWDGRHASAETQALRVIGTHAEMGLDEAELVKVVAKDDGYRAQLEKAGVKLGPEAIARALVTFEIEHLTPGQSPLDRFARGEAELSPEVAAGFDLFVGKARCARCHVPPLFGGSRPPDFSTAVYAVLGVPATPEAKNLDADPGRGEVTKRPLDQGAFKTPTVRNAHRTAPYFHHGAYATLAEVVDFYDRGGGAGLGLEVAHQDPDVTKLDLTAEEKKTLLAFIEQGLADPNMPPRPEPPSD